jgi:putative ABC transport system substrate-binding protein
MHATATIPIVIVNVSDPVGSGLVASLARPGGNITGMAAVGPELAEKSAELMHALVPKATRIAVLMSDNPIHPAELKAIQNAATTIGLTVLPTMARSPEDFEEAFASMAKKDAQALIVLGGAPFSTPQQIGRIVELTARTKLPTLYPTRQFVDAGGLLSFQPNRWEKWRLTAGYVDKVLKGAKPVDLPVVQPTIYDLVINLKTAKALGLTVPQSVLLRADAVIQ